jgi:hypothetical protein
MAEVKIWYDREGDYFEITFEDAYGTMEETEEEGVLERRTPDGRVIGFGILGFSRYNLSILRLPFAITAVPAPTPTPDTSR